MNRLASVLVLACCVATALPARADDDTVVVDRGRIEGVLGHSLQELARLEGLAEGCQSQQCARIARSLRRLEGQLRSLHDEVASAPERREPQAPPPAPALQPVGPDKLHDILSRMNAEPFSEGKLRVLEDAAGWAYFTSDQVVDLLKHLTFGHDKLAALKVLAPRILDPQNGYHIYGAFTFSSDKQAAQRIMAHASH